MSQRQVQRFLSIHYQVANVFFRRQSRYRRQASCRPQPSIHNLGRGDWRRYGCIIIRPLRTLMPFAVSRTTT